MARYRTYKPQLFTDEKLIECSVDARFCFLGLLPFLDDMGRRQYHPRTIKVEVFPADTEYTPEVVDALVQELAKVGIVELYDVGKMHYLRVPHFLRHQYIKKPSHSYIPPSPSEGPDAVRCRCVNCLNKTSFVENNGDNDAFLQEHPHQYRTSTPPVGYEDGTSTEPVRNQWGAEVIGIVKGIGKGEDQNQHQEQNQEQHQPQRQNPVLETNVENRRAQIRALEEISIRMVDLLHLPRNALILEALTKSIEVKARSKQCSLEAAAQQIAARAAFVAVEYPPEDWVLWFQDVRYEYVAQGDKRLDDRRVQARPVCGGSRCSEGWEPVKIGEVTVLRRCPDCVRLWEDMG